MVLGEVAYQVYYTVLCEEVCHSLDPWAPRFVEVHVQVSKYNGVLESLQGLLQVGQVLQSLRGWVYANDWVPGESGNNLAAYHICPVVACGLNPTPNRPLPCHYYDASLISPLRWLEVPLSSSTCIRYGYGNTLPWRSSPWSVASRQSPRTLPPVWPAPARSPGHVRCLNSQWQSRVSVGAGGAAESVPCAGGRCRVQAVGAMGYCSVKVK